MKRVLPLAALIAALAGCGVEAPAPERTVTIELPGGGSGGELGEEEVARAEDRCPGASLQPADGNLSEVAAATLCLVNHEREREGLAPLADDRRLAGAAQRKAADMVERGYFEHVGPDGRDVGDWVDGTGYLPDGGYSLGENIAWAGEGGASPARVVDGWMGSPSHRRNILRGEFEDSGIGVVAGVPESGARPGGTYAHFFGSQDPPG